MKKKTEEVYNYIIKYMLKHNYPPSVREIGDGVKLSSTSSVFAHLEKLKSKGRINMVDRSPRTITVPGIYYSDQRILPPDAKTAD